MKTFVEMVGDVALNVGLRVPNAVMTSAAREWVEMPSVANECGLELVRRADWGGLQSSTTLTGDGSTSAFTLPTDYVRLSSGRAVTSSTSTLRALTHAEWVGLPASVGTPRYFLLEGRTMSVWPTPDTGDDVDVQYISDQWCDSGRVISADADTTIFPDDLFTKALIARWRRQKGMDYADWEAEYEGALQDYAGFDDRRAV